MQIILQKAIFDDEKLRSYITRLTVTELNNLATPCHYPDWKKHFYELIHLTGLDEKDIKDFAKRFYSSTKSSVTMAKYNKVSQLQIDPGSNLLVILMYHFIQKRDQTTYQSLLIYHLIRQYGNFIRIALKFCKPEVFSYTLNHLNPTHLFSREKTIPNALIHLATEIRKRYTGYITELNAEKISNMLYESRGRIAQSIKSFAEAYYKYDEKGFGITSGKETEDGEEILPAELEKSSRIAELVANKICVYKEVDHKALEQARSLTKVNVAFTAIITNELQKPELVNDIKFIIELFFKDVRDIKDICGKNFISYVRKLMSIKRTSKEVYFKNEINKLLLKIIKHTKIESRYKSLTNQTQFQFNSFLAFYLTMYTRNLIC
jgi:hypothetical protein